MTQKSTNPSDCSHKGIRARVYIVPDDFAYQFLVGKTERQTRKFIQLAMEAFALSLMNNGDLTGYDEHFKEKSGSDKRRRVASSMQPAKPDSKLIKIDDVFKEVMGVQW